MAALGNHSQHGRFGGRGRCSETSLCGQGSCAEGQGGSRRPNDGRNGGDDGGRSISRHLGDGVGAESLTGECDVCHVTAPHRSDGRRRMARRPSPPLSDLLLALPEGAAEQRGRRDEGRRASELQAVPGRSQGESGIAHFPCSLTWDLLGKWHLWALICIMLFSGAKLCPAAQDAAEGPRDRVHPKPTRC
jgi:hypothetical protein